MIATERAARSPAGSGLPSRRGGGLTLEVTGPGPDGAAVIGAELAAVPVWVAGGAGEAASVVAAWAEPARGGPGDAS